MTEVGRVSPYIAVFAALSRTHLPGPRVEAGPQCLPPPARTAEDAPFLLGRLRLSDRWLKAAPHTSPEGDAFVCFSFPFFQVFFQGN